MVVPRKKVVPEATSGVNVSMAQLSDAVGSVQVTAVVQSPASVVTVMSAGIPLMVGTSLSVTVMLKLSVVAFPAASVAV